MEASGMEKNNLDLLTTREVAEILKCHVEVARRLICKEKLGFKVGKRHLVPRHELEEFITSKKVK